MTKQAMRPSEELLSCREDIAGCERDAMMRALTGQVRVFLGRDAYRFLCAEPGEGNVLRWAIGRTHLEVVELIERAAVAAMREEQGV